MRKFPCTKQKTSFSVLVISDGQMCAWHKYNKVLSFICTKSMLKSGSKGLMVWGCISANGVSKIIVLKGTANSQVCIS